MNGIDDDTTTGAASVGPERARTGDDAVDEALSRLSELDDAPLRAHVGIVDAVHTALQDRLADTEA